MKFKVGDKVIFKYNNKMPHDFKEFEGKILTIGQVDQSPYPYKTEEMRSKYDKPFLFTEDELEFASISIIEQESKKF